MIKIPIISHIWNKCYIPFHTYFDLLPFNLVYFVLKMVILSWKIVFSWLGEPYIYMCVCNL